MRKRIGIYILILGGLWITCHAQAAGTPEQWLAQAARHEQAHQTDSALALYNRLIASRPLHDPEGQLAMVTALNRAGIIYLNKGNYLQAYHNLLDALALCEQYGIGSEQARLYNNIGNIYYHFRQYDAATGYYRRALALTPDSASAGYYNNLGQALADAGETDSALHYLHLSLGVCRRWGSDRLFALYNSLASLYRQEQRYDSAFHYYRLSTMESRKSHRVEHEAQNLSDLGELFLETGQADSARLYVGLSNALARENGFMKVRVENELILSRIHELEGDTGGAFVRYKQYAGLRDSLFNAGIFGDIGQLQRSYEAAKAERRIEQLEVERRHKERTLWIALGGVAVLSAVLLYIYRQNRRLNKAYRALVAKNIEIKQYEDKEKERKTQTPSATHDALYDKILAVMEDTEAICQPDFSVNRLAVAVGSNPTYVSRAIKNATGKPFRAFLNGYRVREAQRIFAEPNATRYTIESVALRVGFRSRNTFHDVFKEHSVVSPNFYLKSVAGNIPPN